MSNDSILQGNVLAELEWRASVNAAKGVHGVKGLANDILVEMLGSPKRSAQDIAESALNALKWDFQVPGRDDQGDRKERLGPSLDVDDCLRGP